MKDDLLLLALNWFYLLELTQVDFYLTQAKYSEDKYNTLVLLEMADSETVHANKVKGYIEHMGGFPTKIGKFLSHASKYIAKLTKYTTTANFFYVNYILESIAFSDYKKIIKAIEPENTFKKEMLNGLIKNLIDEDEHRNWFLGTRRLLQKKGN